MSNYVNSLLIFGGALIAIVVVAFIIGVVWLVKKLFY